MKTAVFTFGRFNPPTIGHVKLITKVKKTARSVGGDSFIFASPSHDSKKNPLTYNSKVKLLTKIARKSNVINNDEIRTPFHALAYLSALNYDTIYMVVGSDRVKEFERNMSKYIGSGEYKNIKKIVVVSAGERDPDAEGVSGMSASKMRQAVVDDNLNTFQSGMPTMINKREVQRVFQEIKRNMNIREWVDIDELYAFICEHGHRFTEDINNLFEANELSVYVVRTKENDVEITRHISGDVKKVLGRSKEGTSEKAKDAPILSKGSIKSIIRPAIQKGEFRVTPTAKEFLDDEIIKAAKTSYIGNTSEYEKDVEKKDDTSSKEERKDTTRSVPTPVSTSPIKRKSMDIKPQGAKVSVSELSINDLTTQYGVLKKKGGNLGLQLEFATVLLARIATGQDIEDLRNDPKFFTFSEEALEQAKGCISQLGPECLQNLKHSTEVDVRGINGGEPKTDLLCGDNRFSMKADGGYQFSSANYSTTGKEFRRALETTAQRVSENPSLKSNKYVQEGILKMVESLEAFPKYLLNQEKIDAKVGENPEIIETLQNTPIEYDDGRDAGMMMLEDGSINPECDFISAREHLDSACSEFLDNYNKAPDEQEEFMRLFKEELTHVQVTGEGLGFDDERAAASHVLTPTGIYAATRKYSKDLAEVNTLRLSVKEKKFGLVKFAKGVAKKLKGRKAVDAGQRTSVRSEVRAGEGLKRAKELANSHKVQIEQIDQQFSNLMEANGIDISSLGTTTEDVKNSVNEEDFTHTMVGVSNIELDMSYIPGVSIDDMTNSASRKNTIRINGKDIIIEVEPEEIPSLINHENSVNEEFNLIFEVQDRADEEDTKSAKKRERSNQKTRRTKEQHQNSSDEEFTSIKKPKAETDVDARFETEIDDPLMSRSGEWIGLEPDMKLDRAKEIKDALYELLADEEMAEKLDPNDKYVKEWYIKTRPFYDAYIEDEKSVTMYSTASDVKDIINNWESLDKQYDNISKKVKKTGVKKSTAHIRDFDPPEPPEEPAAEGGEEKQPVDESFSNLFEKNAKIEMALPGYPYQNDNWEVGYPPRPVKIKRKTNEDYGSGFDGTSDYVRKLIKDTPGAEEPDFLKKQKKGESKETKCSKGTANRV